MRRMINRRLKMPLGVVEPSAPFVDFRGKVVGGQKGWVVGDDIDH